MAPPRRRAPRTMSAAAYEIVAGIVRKIEDEAMRKAVADHFATEFNRRSKSFDSVMWERATGGKPAPDSAA